MQWSPFEPSAIERFGSFDEWQQSLPDLIATSLRRWGLTAETAYSGGEAASVLSVRRADGSMAVLKNAFPHAEGRWEAVGLAAFPPGCAPEILDQDAWTWTLLLERVDPGSTLGASDLPLDEAMAAALELHARLGTGEIPDGVPSLSSAMADSAATAWGRLPEQARALDDLGVRGLVEEGLAELGILASSAQTITLLHGDYNPGNVIWSRSAGWLAVDPKPLFGDPAFDLCPLLSQLGHPLDSEQSERFHPEHLWDRGLGSIADFGIDAQRVARWARALAAVDVTWSIHDGAATLARDAAALLAWSRLLGR